MKRSAMLGLWMAMAGATGGVIGGCALPDEPAPDTPASSDDAALAGTVEQAATSGSWNFDLKTSDSNPGGRTYGSVDYFPDGNCYAVDVNGYVDDREADGYSVVVYLRAQDCGNGNRWTDIQAGYIGGESKPIVRYSSGYQRGKNGSGLNHATAKICLRKDGKDYYCRQA